MTQLRRLVLVCVASALLQACASTYRSPDLPTGGAAAIAVLEVEDFQLGAKFYISAVDGKPRGVGWFNRFELTPGRRAITVGVNSRWNFSIVEKESGKRVDEPLE
jgi:hypothetical protein